MDKQKAAQASAAFSLLQMASDKLTEMIAEAASVVIVDKRGKALCTMQIGECKDPSRGKSVSEVRRDDFHDAVLQALREAVKRYELLLSEL